MEQDRVEDLHDSNNSDKDDGDEPPKDVGDTVPLLDDDDKQFTLGKKKSWFGSLREMGSKLGLRAKSTAGGPRGEIHQPENEAPTTTPQRHNRNKSVANSLRGSFRSLGHIKRKGPGSPISQRRSMSVEVQAEQVPLPSSPINTSATAPTLSLDIGSSGLMPMTFFSKTLSDPANIATGTPAEERRLHIPPEMEARFAQENVGRMNSESSGGSDKRSKIFERSVTPPNDPERRTLRNMRSLNALADSCTAEQTAVNDDAEATPEASQPESQAKEHEHLTSFEKLVSEMDTPDRDFFSDATIEFPPSDMPPLSRQDAHEPTTPSRGRQIVLPFRPKHSAAEFTGIVQVAIDMMKDVDETSQGTATPRNSENLSPNPLDRIPLRESSSSDSMRSRTPDASGLEDANHRFSFDNWLKISSTSPASSDELRPSPRREASGCTDSLSTDEAITTPEARLVEFGNELMSSAGVGPLELRDMMETEKTSPMGSRIDFNLKRSERNMRYNAIHQVFSTRHYGFDDIDANQLANINVDEAYASSPMGQPRAGDDQEASPPQESAPVESPPASADGFSDASSITYIASAAEVDLASAREELAAAITVLEGTGSISACESSESTSSLVDMILRQKKSEDSKTALSGFKKREPWERPVDSVLFWAGSEHSKCCAQLHGTSNRSTATVGRQETGSMPSPVKDRVASAADTLDRALDRFGSPVRVESPDKGGKYTVSPPWNTVPKSPRRGNGSNKDEEEDEDDKEIKAPES